MTTRDRRRLRRVAYRTTRLGRKLRHNLITFSEYSNKRDSLFMRWFADSVAAAVMRKIDW